jgi:hypothetical protein
MSLDNYLVPVKVDIENITTPSARLSFDVTLRQPVWYTRDHRVRLVQVSLPPVGRHLNEDLQDPTATVTCYLSNAEKVFLAKYPDLKKGTTLLERYNAFASNGYTVQSVADSVKSSGNAAKDAANYNYFTKLEEKPEDGKRVLRNVTEDSERIDIHAYIRKGTYFSCQEMLDQLNYDLSRAGVRHLQLELRDSMLRVKDITVPNIQNKGHRPRWQMYLNRHRAPAVTKEVLGVLGVHVVPDTTPRTSTEPYYVHVEGARAYQKANRGMNFCGKDLYHGSLRNLEMTVEVLSLEADGTTSAVRLPEPLAIIPLKGDDEGKSIHQKVSYPKIHHMPVLDAEETEQELKRLRFNISSSDQRTMFALGSGTINLLLEIYRENVKTDSREVPDIWVSGNNLR